MGLADHVATQEEGAPRVGHASGTDVRSRHPAGSTRAIRRRPVIGGRDLIVVLFATCVAAHAGEPAQITPTTDHDHLPGCQFYSTIGDRSYKLPLTRQEIDAAPQWTPDSGEEPPISAGQAIRIAQKEIRG